MVRCGRGASPFVASQRLEGVGVTAACPLPQLTRCRPRALHCSAQRRQQHEVTLYTKHDCPLCHKAKAVLERVRAEARRPLPSAPQLYDLTY
jgi:hypothetical protein